MEVGRHMCAQPIEPQTISRRVPTFDILAMFQHPNNCIGI